jgi:hypothetical protein
MTNDNKTATNGAGTANSRERKKQILRITKANNNYEHTRQTV